jgi:4-alpha-glucanotransferase
VKGPQRRAGVLLHVTALPAGTFGAAAQQWLALLGRQGIGAWQVLPLAPTDGTGSPYSSPSGSALNPALLDAAAAALPGTPRQLRAFRRWQRRERAWLRDHCRFMVLRRLHGGAPWWQWPVELAERRPAALRRFDRLQAGALQAEALQQWQLQLQWQALQRTARQQVVQLIGDLPFYVAHDSADVWAHPALFSLGQGGSLLQQSGVPPDYFSATGQLWGTPVYRWGLHLLSGFRWWLARLERQLELFDRLRLIAEDLGVITPAVEALRDGFGLSGMKILQFAFDGNPTNPYLPANMHGSRWVVYTGTHDNATSLGWWRQLDGEARGQVQALLGAPVTAPGWQLLELALVSGAELVVVPLQDLLELGDEARFNTPGTTGPQNWSWRLDRPLSTLEGPLRGYGVLAAAAGRGLGMAN